MKNNRIQLMDKYTYINYEAEKHRKAGDEINILSDFLHRINRLQYRKKIPENMSMSDLVAIGLPIQEEIRRGGMWTHDSRIPYIELNGERFYVRENVGNISCLKTRNFRQDIVCRDVEKNIVLYGPDSEKMYIMTDMWCNPYYGIYERFSIRELPKEILYSMDANEGMQWLGADVVPEDDHFKEPVIITDFGCDCTIDKWSEIKCFVDKSSNEFIYVNQFGKEEILKLNESQINGIIKAMEPIEEKIEEVQGFQEEGETIEDGKSEETHDISEVEEVVVTPDITVEQFNETTNTITEEVTNENTIEENQTDDLGDDSL